jgi:hypothetical protein
MQQECCASAEKAFKSTSDYKTYALPAHNSNAAKIALFSGYWSLLRKLANRFVNLLHFCHRLLVGQLVNTLPKPVFIAPREFLIAAPAAAVPTSAPINTDSVPGKPTSTDTSSTMRSWKKSLMVIAA